MTGKARYAHRYNSNINVMGVTNPFLIGFKGCPIRGCMPGTVNVAKNL